MNPDTPLEALRKLVESNLWEVYKSNHSENMEERTDAILGEFKSVLAETERAPQTYFTLKQVKENKSIGWFTQSGIVFQVIKIGESAKLIGRIAPQGQSTGGTEK